MPWQGGDVVVHAVKGADPAGWSADTDAGRPGLSFPATCQHRIVLDVVDAQGGVPIDAACFVPGGILTAAESPVRLFAFPLKSNRAEGAGRHSQQHRDVARGRQRRGAVNRYPPGCSRG